MKSFEDFEAYVKSQENDYLVTVAYRVSQSVRGRHFNDAAEKESYTRYVSVEYGTLEMLSLYHKWLNS